MQAVDMASSILGHRSRLFANHQDLTGLGITVTTLSGGLPLDLLSSPQPSLVRKAPFSGSFLSLGLLSPPQKGLTAPNSCPYFSSCYSALSLLWLCNHLVISCLPRSFPVHKSRDGILSLVLFLVPREILIITEGMEERPRARMLFPPPGRPRPHPSSRDTERKLSAVVQMSSFHCEELLCFPLLVEWSFPFVFLKPSHMFL